MINLRGAKSTERVIWLRQDPSAACAAREVSDMTDRRIKKHTEAHRNTEKHKKSTQKNRETNMLLCHKSNTKVDLVRIEKHLTCQ